MKEKNSTDALVGKLRLLERRVGLFIVTWSFLTLPYWPRATLQGRPTVSEPLAFGIMGTGFSYAYTVPRPGFFHRIFIANPFDRSAKRT